MLIIFHSEFIALWVEWAKSRACAHHWHEEVMLLVEEMWHVIEYFSWKAWWWAIQGTQREDAHLDIYLGAAAYATKQMAMYENMAKAFTAKWYPFLVKKNLPAQWPVQYIPDIQPLQQLQPISDMDVDP